MISIIIPIYNVEKYLRECLSSICQQIECEDEIILINDGSTDNSEMICHEYKRKYSNVILINQENQGQAVARNIGILTSSQEYIMFVDADDYISDIAIKIIKNILNSDSVDVLLYSADVKNELQDDMPSDYQRKNQYCNKIMDGLSILKQSFYDNYIVSPCLAAYKKSFIESEKLIFPPGIFFEDVFFHLNFMSKAKTVLMIEDKLYIRRYRQESTMTSKNNERKCKDRIILQKLMWDYIKAEPDLFVDANFVKDFISFWSMHTLNALVEDVDMELACKMQRIFSELFMEYWKDEFLESDININHLTAIYELIAVIRNDNADRAKLYTYFKNKLIDCVVDILKVIPLDDANTLIGIYGVGMHTNAILSLYERYVGAIKSDYFFIQTQKDTEIFDNRKVVSAEEIEKKVDFILVSSKIYQDDIYRNLQRINIPKEKIVLFYNSKSLVDLIKIYDLLEDSGIH